MDRWKGSLAVVTGASSGIGAAICEKFINAGINVVGLARRVHRVQQLSEKISSNKTKLHPLHCDVGDEESVLEAFSWIEENLGGISILVNNAGILLSTRLIDGDTILWKKTIDVNVIGLLICTRESIKSMQKHKIDGQIIHISSIAGHFVPTTETPIFNIYPSTKFAITAATENLRRELIYCKSKIKVSSVCPGLVDTELVSGHPEIDITPAVAPMLSSADVADSCVYILSTPPNVQIHTLMIRPIGEQL